MAVLPSRQFYEYAAATAAGIVLLLFTCVKFIAIPYAGFDFNPASGLITYVDPQAVLGEPLRTGDRLLQVGHVSWQDYQQDLRQPLLAGTRPGEVVPVIVEREGERVRVVWVLPGPSFQAALGRSYTLWVPYAFWAAGTASLFFLRPRDTRRRLMVAFNYLTALWLISGSFSSSHIAHSAVILRMTIWLCLPVYWHLHWQFPQPLGRLPPAVLRAVYLVGSGLAAAEWFGLLPHNMYFTGFLFAVAGSLSILSAHVILRPEQRRDLALLGLAVALILLPSIALGVSRLAGVYPAYGGGALLALPVLPGAYFFAVYRRQLGGLELRANRVIGQVLYLLLLFSVFLLAAALAHAWFPDPSAQVMVTAAAALLAGLASIWLYPAFQRWVEHRLLGMPLPSTRLLEAYSARMVTSLEIQQLVHILLDEILPSLLIRQAALLRLEQDGGGKPRLVPVLSLEVDPGQLPQFSDLPALQALAGRPRPQAGENGEASPCPWVRLVLPFTVYGQPAGLCLFGRRDPDDEYFAAEIPVLQALVDQTALALLNIEQAERLRTLSKINIERQETERHHLALELHDDVLGQMAMLRMSVEETSVTPPFLQAYESAVERTRQIIGGLYPGMLHYGLRVALEELVDTLSAQAEGGPEIDIDLPSKETRYPQPVELHLFRILQQACQNAIQHARAEHISIQGELEPGSVCLLVKDDGFGFDTAGRLDLPWLLANRHFGLAGIFERAAFIGAEVEIDSRPGQGTWVRVAWKASQPSTSIEGC